MLISDTHNLKIGTFVYVHGNTMCYASTHPTMDDESFIIDHDQICVVLAESRMPSCAVYFMCLTSRGVGNIHMLHVYPIDDIRLCK